MIKAMIFWIGVIFGVIPGLIAFIVVGLFM